MQPVQAPTQAAPAAVPPPSAAAAPTSATLQALAQRELAPEDVFFHKFMTLDSVKQRAAANRSKRKSKAAAKKAQQEGGDVLPDESSSDEEAGGGEAAGEDSDAEDAFLDAAEAIEVWLGRLLNSQLRACRVVTSLQSKPPCLLVFCWCIAHCPAAQHRQVVLWCKGMSC